MFQGFWGFGVSVFQGFWGLGFRFRGLRVQGGLGYLDKTE